MFDSITTEQKEAFKRRTRAIDALLKSAIETQPKKTQLQLPRHLVPILHMPHLERRAA